MAQNMSRNNKENNTGGAEDKDFEFIDQTLRPSKWDEYIGQENIKKNLQNKRLNHEQNLNFILSGGDYSAFVEE